MHSAGTMTPVTEIRRRSALIPPSSWTSLSLLTLIIHLLSPFQPTLGHSSQTIHQLRHRGGDTKTNNSDNNKPIEIVIGIDGGTESIRACCFNAHTGHILGSSHAVPYKTSHPSAGWAEQSPDEWYSNMCQAVRGALSTLKNESETGDNDDNNSVDGDSTCEYQVKALCCDTTCCSVVALSSTYKPLRPCLLWMDARSAKQAAQIMDIAKQHSENAQQSILETFPELRVNSHGQGPISAEWLLPKAMWMKQNELDIWNESRVICEYQDYINYKLTGQMVASSCNAAVRWHHDGWEVLEQKEDEDHGIEDDTGDNGHDHRGRPMKLYKALGMEDLADKLPKRTLAMGDVVGGLTEEAASDLGLPVGTTVVQGGPDAFVGMIGLGTIHPHQICLITGSSHLHCLITPTATSAPGTWGAYHGAPLPHLNLAEGGQSSTGSLVRWVRDLISSGNDGDEKVSYQVLDEEASLVAPGCDGLVALETWQGSRTPHTDPLARGAFIGLTLSHTRAHMFRAILESVCFGTRSCFDALEAAAAATAAKHQSSDDTATHKSNEVIIAGGATCSELWLQLHADITGRTFLLNENTDGPLLGCAILASVGAGIYGSVDEAVKNMVRRERRIEPRVEVKEVYDRLYEEVYLKVRPAVKGIFHALAELRGGAMMSDGDEYKDRKSYDGYNDGMGDLRGGSINNDSEQEQPNEVAPSRRTPIISPSLLASD